MPMQITAHAIGIAMRFALSGAEWAEAELSCLRFFFFFFCFLGGFAALFFFFFWLLCLFLDGLGAFLLSQSALRSLKCPFWKWPCPSKSLIRALGFNVKVLVHVFHKHTEQDLVATHLPLVGNCELIFIKGRKCKEVDSTFWIDTNDCTSTNSLSAHLYQALNKHTQTHVCIIMCAAEGR